MKIAASYLLSLCAVGLSACASSSAHSITSASKHQYTIQAHVYEMPRALAGELLGQTGSGMWVRPESLQSRIESVASTRDDVSTLFAPSIRLSSGVSATIANTSKFEYVKGYGVDAAGHPTPMKADVVDGLSLEFRANETSQGLELATDFKQSQLLRPIAESSVTLADHEIGRVQLPIVVARESTDRHVLGNQECLASVLGGTDPESERVTLVLTTLRRSANSRSNDD